MWCERIFLLATGFLSSIELVESFDHGWRNHVVGIFGSLVARHRNNLAHLEKGKAEI